MTDLVGETGSAFDRIMVIVAGSWVVDYAATAAGEL